jgi:hypothetical protein
MSTPPACRPTTPRATRQPPRRPAPPRSPSPAGLGPLGRMRSTKLFGGLAASAPRRRRRRAVVRSTASPPCRIPRFGVARGACPVCLAAAGCPEAGRTGDSGLPSLWAGGRRATGPPWPRVALRAWGRHRRCARPGRQLARRAFGPPDGRPHLRRRERRGSDSGRRPCPRRSGRERDAPARDARVAGPAISTVATTSGPRLTRPPRQEPLERITASDLSEGGGGSLDEHSGAHGPPCRSGAGSAVAGSLAPTPPQQGVVGHEAGLPPVGEVGGPVHRDAGPGPPSRARRAARARSAAGVGGDHRVRPGLVAHQAAARPGRRSEDVDPAAAH